MRGSVSVRWTEGCLAARHTRKVVVATKKMARPANEALVGLDHSAVVKEALLVIAIEAARALAIATAATIAATREVDMLIAASLETTTPDSTIQSNTRMSQFNST